MVRIGESINEQDELPKSLVEHAAGKEQRRAKGLLVLAEARVAEAESKISQDETLAAAARPNAVHHTPVVILAIHHHQNAQLIPLLLSLGAEFRNDHSISTRMAPRHSDPPPPPPSRMVAQSMRKRIQSLDLPTADLRVPPSDRPDFRVCHSLPLEPPSDRSDSLLEAPIAGDEVTDGLRVVGCGKLRLCEWMGLDGGFEQCWEVADGRVTLVAMKVESFRWMERWLGKMVRIGESINEQDELPKSLVEHAAGKEQRRAKGLLVLAEARVAEAGGQSARTSGWWCRNHGAATMHERQHVELGLVLMGFVWVIDNGFRL
ncbi:hypothetical protein GQ457_11G029890 [Hibiscus cannabinus]